MSRKPFVRGVAIGLLAICLSAAASASCLWPYWQTVATVPAPSLIDRVVAADLNGDGKPDLVAGGAEVIFTALNGGGGSFGAPATLATGALGGFLVADFTADGKADVLAVDRNASAPRLLLHAGIGDGTFAAPAAFAVPFVPVGLDAADFDGDGKLDVAIANTKTVAVLVRTVDGFAESARATLSFNAWAVTAADFDDDGFVDVVVAPADSNLFAALYGKGNGTFEPVAPLPAGAAFGVAAGDFDKDGLPDLGWCSASGAGVMLNHTGRQFGDPLLYPVTSGRFRDVALADVNGDGTIDLVESGRRIVVTWQGLENGLGHRGTFRPDPSNQGSSNDYDGLALADFDGDGKIDAAATMANTFQPANGNPRVEIYRNRCGASTLTLTAQAPVIAEGDSATIVAALGWPALPGNSFYTFDGTVTLKEGSTVLGTSSVAVETRTATFVVPSLSAGEHTLTASYSGDEQHEQTASAPIVEQVTSDSSTVALTVTPSPQYNQPIAIAANVTSTVAGTPTGSLRVVIDGAAITSAAAPSVSVSRSADLGSHTVTVFYDGDATHPAASATATFDVTRAELVATGTAQGYAAGQSFQLAVSLTPAHCCAGLASATGSITMSEGGAVLASGPIESGTASVVMPGLAAGRHFVHVSYAGDPHYLPLESYIIHTVFPAGGATTMDARGRGDAVRVSWNGAYPLIVRRRTGNAPWSGGMCCDSQPWWDDTTAAPNTVYVYQMDAYDGTTHSNADVGMRITFTDDPLLAGMSIKAVHLTEIVAATNLLRTAASLPALVLPIAASQPVTAAQVNTLRAAINEARAGLGAATFTFTDTIAPGGVIRALQVQELRESVR